MIPHEPTPKEKGAIVGVMQAIVIPQVRAVTQSMECGFDIEAAIQRVDGLRERLEEAVAGSNHDATAA